MRCAANRLVYPASTSPGLDASGVGISRSSPTSPVSASSCNRSPLRSSRSRTLGFVTGARAPGRGGAGRHAAGLGLYRVVGGPWPPRGPARYGGPPRAPYPRAPHRAVRHQKAGLGVPNRLPEAGTVGRERGGTARRRLHVRDAPTLLRARQHGGPRTTQQPTLIRLGHEPEEPRSLAQAQRPRQALEARTVIAPSGDFEDQVGTRLPRECQGPEGDLHSFITLEAPHVQERRLAGSRFGGVGGVPGRIHARINDFDPLPGHPPAHQVVARALRDSVKPRAAIRPGDGPLGRPHDTGDRPARFPERSRAEEVWHEGAERPVGERREEQRELVDVFDHDVIGVRPQQPAHYAARVQRERVSPARAMHPQAIEVRLARRPRPTARHQVDRVAAARQAPEDFMQVRLGTPGVWVLAVVPVDEQDSHSAPDSRATASSTPFTNPGALAPANQWASFTASSITTRGGVEPSASSASASRRMLRSTTPTRSSRQCSAVSATRASNSGRPAIAWAARSAPRS